MRTLTDDSRAILAEQNADATQMEYERIAACWKDCIVFDAYHECLDRELDRREDQAFASDSYLALLAGDGEEFNLDMPPFQ